MSTTELTSGTGPGNRRREGGVGCAVTDALLTAGQPNLAIDHLAVRGMPGSGSSAGVLAWAGIDADHIAAAARQLVGGP